MDNQVRWQGGPLKLGSQQVDEATVAARGPCARCLPCCCGKPSKTRFDPELQAYIDSRTAFVIKPAMNGCVLRCVWN